MTATRFHLWRQALLAGALIGCSMIGEMRAATLIVSGQIEGDVLTLQYEGDTLDYYKFEVVTPGTVRIEAPRQTGILHMLAAYIGRDDEFGFIGSPFRIEYPACLTPGCLEDPPTMFLERHLNAGIYVLTTGVRVSTSYDIFDGFVPVNPNGGGFARGSYSFTITGDVRGLEYWDGHLNGTFTVTTIPELPSSALLGGCGLVFLHRHRPGKGRRAVGVAVTVWPLHFHI